MQLASLFRAEGLLPEDIAVMFHVSDKPALHRALPFLAEEAPELFDAFQNQHGPGVEATLTKRKYMASFVAEAAGEFVFAGLFAISGNTYRSMVELDADPRRKELQRRYGDINFVDYGAEKGQAGRLEFDLIPAVPLADLIGRLRLRKPPRAKRVYRFLAENLDCPIVEITRDRRLVQPPPEWREFIVDASDLRGLPQARAARLSEWGGVYLFVDQTDFMRYVGAAYGADNLLARWLAHVAGNNGITKSLEQRDPSNFRFSILERTSPDLPADEVIAIEQNWKRRLDTLHPHGLNQN